MKTPFEAAKTAEQIDYAATLGHQAHLASASATPRTKASWLHAIADALHENGEELVALAHSETNLAVARLQGEVRRTAFQLDLFAKEVSLGVPLEATVDHVDQDWGMGPRPDIRRVNVPLGVVGVFGASNFPFAFSVIGGDSAAALAAGCAVLHKIHDGHAKLGLRTAEVVCAALENAGAPQGLFAVLQGREAANAMVEHPLVKAIGFTGSTAGGRALFNRANARPEPIPFFGELGSINPVFVLPEAWKNRSEEILRGYASSFTMGMGQFCTKPGVLFVPDGGDQEKVHSILTDVLDQVPLTKLLTPGLRDSFVETRDEVASLAGVRNFVPGSDEEIPKPAILDVSAEDVRKNPEVLNREMFGPATILVRYQHQEELAELAALMEGQLTATIQGDVTDDSSSLLNVLTGKAGRVLWNEWPTGVTVSYAQNHGGPYPATTMAGTTSVGTNAISRFMRPVAYQNVPEALLPAALHDSNPWNIMRRVDGKFEYETTQGAHR